MTKHTSEDMTVLFADVAGSVELYSALGDFEAHRRIVNFLQRSAHHVERHHGRVIETIGDEIMCAFGEADHALAAACAIQENLRRDGQWALNVRAGMHSGQTSVENGHPFGDTVNVSARVVGLAKAGQVMLTDHTYQRLNEANKYRTRRFKQVYIKGKSEPYTIHQALWDQEDGTVTVTVTSSFGNYIERRRNANCAKLRYRENEIDLTEDAEFLIGRGVQCHCRVNSTTASRIHATVKCHDGKLVLADRSTNGTFIRTLPGRRSTDNAELFLHHNEWITTCSGVLSLGKPVSNGDANLVQFQCS